MSDPSAKTHTNESRRTISEVESLRAELAQLRTEGERLREALKETMEELCGWLEDRMAGTGRTPEDNATIRKAIAALQEARHE